MNSTEKHVGLEALHSVSKAALVFVKLEIEPSFIWSKLGVLMDLENVLDKGRMFGMKRTTEEEEAKFKQVVANMDELRGSIRELLDAQDRSEAVEFMQARGRKAMNQFSLALE